MKNQSRVFELSQQILNYLSSEIFVFLGIRGNFSQKFIHENLWETLELWIYIIEIQTLFWLTFRKSHKTFKTTVYASAGLMMSVKYRIAWEIKCTKKNKRMLLSGASIRHLVSLIWIILCIDASTD